MAYEDREFARLFKHYFVDVSARLITDAFFNLADGTVVLCNASSNRSKTTFGDRLTNFCVGELSFHMIKFIDTTFLDEFKRIFNIPSECVYLVNVVKLNTILGKAPLSELNISHDNGILKVVPSSAEYTSSKHDIGIGIYDFHALDMLKFWYNYTMSLGTAEHKNKYPHVVKEYAYTRPCRPNYILGIDLNDFGDEFKGYRNNVNYIMHDGLSHPSIKSFVPTGGKLHEYIWKMDDSLFIMFGYADDKVTIRSIRPNVRVIPILKAINFDNTITDFKYE